MSISSIASSSYVAPSSQVQKGRGMQGVNGTDSDGDGDGGGKKAHGHHHGGGQIQSALMQALQAVGLTPPTSASSGTATSTAQNNSGTDSDGDSDGSTAAASSTKEDLRQFMHALFQAVKGESTTASTATGNDPKANFASGLAALITQASNGSAPAELQDAFSKVVADLQPAAATTTTTAATDSASTTVATSQAVLQKLLTQLQQNLGYGATNSSAALGNFVSTQA